MSNTTAEIGEKQIIVHDDEETPLDFVADLLHAVFGKSEAEAAAFVETITRESQAVCAIRPSAVADVLVAKAQELIAAAGHPLRITVRALSKGVDEPHCAFCGNSATADRILFQGDAVRICDICVRTAASHLSEVLRRKTFKYAYEAIAWHFGGMAQEEIVTTTRRFPGHMRADLQLAVDELFSTTPLRFFGIHEPHRYETLTFAALTQEGQRAATIVAAQFQDVDIGESEPVRCLHNGLWLRRQEHLRYAVVLSSHREFGQESGTCIEIAVPRGEQGEAFTRSCFKALEAAIDQAHSYRGKVLSFEEDVNYRGQAKGLLVHRVPVVRREEVVLPEATLRLLDRNVLSFVGSREGLRKLGQSTRKGVLL